MNFIKLNVKTENQKYPIIIGKNILDKIQTLFIKNAIHFDLPNFIKSQLKANKITNIDMINIDTFDKKNNFFSARKALELEHDDYGINISIIMIN